MTNDDPKASPPTIHMIETQKLHPNEHNPNRMTPGQFKQLVLEIEHLGRLPKPIVVRPDGDGYEIVDGEHNWRAAQEVGLKEVPCEVVEVDDFEARRQTYKRNQHGRHNPILLGLMFVQMMQVSGLKQRQLAKKLKISEGTVRNCLAYLSAVKLRNRYAGEDRRDEIAGLPIRVIRTYLELPPEIGNPWLDAGGSLKLLELYASRKKTWCEIGPAIVAAGLAEFISSRPSEFDATLRHAIRLAEWALTHRRLDGVEQYVRPVAELRLPVQVLAFLPCRVDCEAAQVLLTPEQWSEILHKCDELASVRGDFRSLLDAAIEMALRQRGYDPGTVLGPKFASMLKDLEAASDFIRDSGYLSVREKWLLSRASADGPEDVVLEAKRLTCERLRARRQHSDDGVAKPEQAARGDIKRLFVECLQEVRRNRIRKRADSLFQDREKLTDAVVAAVSKSEVVQTATIDGRPATDVLAEQIAQLDGPEFALLAGAVIGGGAAAAGERWLDAAGGEMDG